MLKFKLPEGLLAFGELKNATDDMIKELKKDAKTKDVAKRIESGLNKAPILAKKESVQKFEEVLGRTLLKHPGLASKIITALLLTD